MDLITMGMNMYSHGVDPGLDFFRHEVRSGDL